MRQSVVFEPMPGKVAVRTEKRGEIMRSGLILLSDPSKSRIGEVIAVYEPFLLNPTDQENTESYVKIGDFVVFGPHNGVRVTVEGEECVILKEAEILTKVRLVRELEENELPIQRDELPIPVKP